MNITCPQCKGEKEVVGIFPVYAEDVPKEKRKPVVKMPCPRCHGSGDVPEEMLEWMKKGKELKQERLDRGVGLRKEAERLGVKSSELSAVEQGRVDPDASPLAGRESGL